MFAAADAFSVDSQAPVSFMHANRHSLSGDGGRGHSAPRMPSSQVKTSPIAWGCAAKRSAPDAVPR